ncbi:type VI secretion system tip protein VgrG [Parapedobacter sp. DT-150]|uniref:type VI secretion system tip protein VgrG n=1 Tax=Parapedobacter sp. DT-150 TaxID=3396162 RepID=UPI003F1A5E32
MPTQADTGLATYNILVGDTPTLGSGDEISHTIRVLDIHVSREINKIPTARLTIVDGSVATADFGVSDSDVFLPGKNIEIKLGYRSQNQPVFKGIIIHVAHHIDANGSHLSVVCKHEVVKMTMGKKSRHYNEVTDSDVASLLLQENNIAQVSVATTTTTHEQLIQAQVSDWDFMISRMDINALLCLIDNDMVALQPLNADEPAVMDLLYGTHIYELDTEVDARTQFTSVSTYTWNFVDQEVQDITGDSKVASAAGSLSEQMLADIAGQPYEMRSAMYMTAEEQQQLADARQLRQTMSKIKGTVKFRGNAQVKPGSFVNLQGVGKYFNGKAFVGAVTHEYAEGSWFSVATLGWDEAFYAESVRGDAAVAETGVLSVMQGLQIGIVTDIIDPKGEGRVKVRLPVVEPESEGVFARVATLDAGSDRGTFFRPEVDDEVMVGFINNDAAHPIILGMLHSSAKPTPFEASEENDEKGYVSRSGIKISIHDGDKRIVMETPGGRKLTMDDQASTIMMEDDSGNSIAMENQGITVKTSGDLTLEAGGTLQLKAMQLAFNADGTAKLESNGGISLKSNGTAELKGAMVTVEGGLVKIN